VDPIIYNKIPIMSQLMELLEYHELPATSALSKGPDVVGMQDSSDLINRVSPSSFAHGFVVERHCPPVVSHDDECSLASKAEAEK
jgi:hypothetical protein